MSRPKKSPSVPKAHELLVMSKMADLYATLNPAARHRVHHHLGEMLDALPTIAAVVEVPEPEPPMMPVFGRGADAAE